MILFSLTAIPLSYLVLSAYVWDRGFDFKKIAVPFGYGAISVIPSFLLFGIIGFFLAPSASGIGLYVYTLIFQHLLPVITGAGAVYVLYFLILKDDSDLLFKITGFFSGLFTFITVFEWLLGFTVPEGYTVFILPLLRLFLILSIPPFLTLGFRRSGPERSIWLAGSLPVPFVSAFVSFLFLINRHIVSAVMLGILIIAGAVWFLVYSKHE